MATAEMIAKPNWIRGRCIARPKDVVSKLMAEDSQMLQVQIVGPHPETNDQTGPWRLVVETQDEGEWECDISGDIALALCARDDFQIPPVPR